MTKLKAKIILRKSVLLRRNLHKVILVKGSQGDFNNG